MKPSAALPTASGRPSKEGDIPYERIEVTRVHGPRLHRDPATNRLVGEEPLAGEEATRKSGAQVEADRILAEANAKRK